MKTKQQSCWTRREFLAVGVGGVAAGVLGRGLAWGAPLDDGRRPPNVVIIFCDDLGYGDVGCFGARKIRTPNLDRMAAEGMKLTDFHTTSSVCSPSRASLLTGREFYRTGVDGVLRPNSNAGLRADEVTIADLLRKQGYATACVGKWHLGDGSQFLPTRHGFDSYFGIPYSNDMGIAAEGKKGQQQTPLMRDEKIIELPVDQSTLTERYTEESIRFITANRAKPFFLYLPHTMPHRPISASARFKGKSEAGLYGDVVECIDWSVGEILRTLRELDLDGTTLVLFTSDNGAPCRDGREAGNVHPSNAPLRGGKETPYEGGHRVPCIARWPGKIPVGKACGELASTMDVLPTVAKLAGTGAPADRVLDGKDIWPLMAGQDGAKSPHEFLCWGAGPAFVRSGKWKFFVSSWKDGADAGRLYDLEADIGETTDVAAANPEVVNRLQRAGQENKAGRGKPPR